MAPQRSPHKQRRDDLIRKAFDKMQKEGRLSRTEMCNELSKTFHIAPRTVENIVYRKP